MKSFFRIFILKFISVLFLVIFSIFGVAAGSHRLYAHRSFKVSTPFKYFLLLLISISGQVKKWLLNRSNNCINLKFVREAHFTGHVCIGFITNTQKQTKVTNNSPNFMHWINNYFLDPHDIRRGRFFAHIGWICMEHRPECQKELRSVDVSDLRADKAVMFQNKHFGKFFLTFVVLIPLFVPLYFWGESAWIAFWVCVVSRYCVNLNNAFTINSIGHSVGSRAYNKEISPADNKFVMIQTLGEGNHNFHVRIIILIHFLN